MSNLLNEMPGILPNTWIATGHEPDEMASVTHQKPVQDLKAGDIILDENKVETAITHIDTHQVAGYFRITAGNLVLEVSGNKLFFTKDGWKQLSELQIGDYLVSATDGSWNKVIEMQEVFESATVFDVFTEAGSLLANRFGVK